MKTALFSFFLIVPIVLILLVLIGVYVYRDAKRRGMNAVLWTLIALLSPALVGFIIYLLARNSYSDLECPQCAAPVEEDYLACPRCGAKLRPACPGCAAPVEPDWKVCPRCAAPLDGADSGVTPPHRRQDKGLRKILIAVILAPLLLIVFAVLSFVLFLSPAYMSSAALQEVTFDEYDQQQPSETVKNAVHSWLDGLEVREDRAYALRYDYYDELTDVNKYYFLIYIPAGGGQSHFSAGMGSGLFGSTFNLELERTGDSGSLLCAQVQNKGGPPKLNITLDGKRIPCQVSVRDYNPTTFFIIPDYSQPETGEAQTLPAVCVISQMENGQWDAAASKQTAVDDPDLLRKLMAAIDGGERLPASHPIYEGMDEAFTNSFSILVYYQFFPEEAIPFAHLMVCRQDGVCYLLDNRIRIGGNIRRLDGDFYGLLESLF